MLISFIYRLFQLGFILVALFGIAALVAQFSGEPLTYQLGSTHLVIARNGIRANAVQLVNVDSPIRDSMWVRNVNVVVAAGKGGRIESGLMRQQVQVIPAEPAAKAGLIMYDLVYFASLSLAFYALYRLFRNFHFKRYFYLENARYLRLAGCFLLLQAALGFGMSALYLSGLKATKLVLVNGVWEETSRLHFPLELDGVLLSLSVCLLILASIFKHATELRKNHEAIA